MISETLPNEDGSSVTSDGSKQNSVQKQNPSSTSSNSNSNDDNCKDAIRTNLSKEGSTSIKQTRVLVLSVLIIAATGICVAVYFISRNTESEQFKSQYDGIALKVFGSFEMLTSRMSAINSIGSAATIAGFNRTSSRTSWPFVTLPSFEQRATTVLSLSLALDVSLYPLVTPQNREEWEDYCVGADKYWM